LEEVCFPDGVHATIQKANPKRISNRIRYYLFERGLLSWDLNRPQTS
jgi:hypothetical protein